MLASEPTDRPAIADDPAWEALGGELDMWVDAGRQATLWWRDDDAAAVTPALERLLELQREHAVPLALAVIPDRLEPGLTLRLAGCEGVIVCSMAIATTITRTRVRGPGSSAIIARSSRSAADLAAGRRATGRGVRRALPAGAGTALEPDLGPGCAAPTGTRFRRAYDLRRPRSGRTGAWHGSDQCSLRSDQMEAGARFAGTERALDQMIGHLRARRMGTADPGEPTGLVTHHLALDAPAWAFVAELLRRARAHPRAAWQGAREVFRR